MGYDLLVEYKKGKDNVVADALSKKVKVKDGREEVTLTAISLPTLDWLEEIKDGYGGDTKVQELLLKDKKGELPSMYLVRNGVLFYKNRLVIGEDKEFRQKLLHLLHASPMVGHSGYDKTLHRVRRDFHWQGMKSDVKHFIRCCDICQSVKVDQSKHSGLLQPLPIPSTPWSQTTMDYIDGLPLSQGQNCLSVMVDRLTKSTHFTPRLTLLPQKQ